MIVVDEVSIPLAPIHSERMFCSFAKLNVSCSKGISPNIIPFERMFCFLSKLNVFCAKGRHPRAESEDSEVFQRHVAGLCKFNFRIDKNTTAYQLLTSNSRNSLLM